MEETTYIYFGDNLFNKLQNFKDVDLPFSVNFKIFNSIKSPSDIFIDDIHLGWSYVVYQTGNKFYHTGFLNSKEDSAEVLKGYDAKLNVSCGANEVYAFSNERNLFRYSTKNNEEVFSFASNKKQKFKDLKSGDQRAVVLFDDGTVNFLNLHEEIPFIPLEIQSSITQIACGKEHVLFLSELGQVFSYGSGSRGQLGHGTIENQDKPMLLEALDGIKIKSISCGGWHSAVISDCGDLYMWGWNESGQLGFPCAELHGNSLPLNEIETVCCLPKLIELAEEKQIQIVSCGTRHTVILTDDLQVWSWGWNQYGQLGHGEYLICDRPCRISFPSRFVPKTIKCAFWSTLIIGSFCT